MERGDGAPNSYVTDGNLSLLRLECNRSPKTPVCQLLRHLTPCNHLLYKIGFQLKEDAEDDLGDVRLTLIPRTLCSLHSHRKVFEHDYAVLIAIELLKFLCTQHRCLVSIELDDRVAEYDLSLVDALRNGVLGRRLHFRGRQNVLPAYVHAAVLKFLKSVADIGGEATSDKSCGHSAGNGPLSVNVPLTNGWAGITTIDVAELNLGEAEAALLVMLLMVNNTVTDLTVGTWIATYESEDSSVSFARYMVKPRSALRKLSLRFIGFSTEEALKKLVGAIAASRTLEDLSVDIVPCGSRGIDLFADVLLRNDTIRRLSVTLPTWWHQSMLHDNVHSDPSNSGRRMDWWVHALANNSTLLSLTMDLLGFQQQQLNDFFYVIAENRLIERVRVLHVPKGAYIESVCRTLRDRGLTERVTIVNYSLFPESLSRIHLCPELKAVNLHTQRFPVNLSEAFGVLSACAHINSLDVSFHNVPDDRAIFVAFAAYLSTSKNLREITIDLGTHSFGDGDGDVESIVIKSLFENHNFQKIDIRTFGFPYDDCKSFAEYVLHSHKLHDLALTTNCNHLFLQYLVPLIAGSYNLLRVCVPTDHNSCFGEHQNTVLDTARRNASFRHESCPVRAGRVGNVLRMCA
ncbi:hypothetical protein HPB51_015466 [Rhipicephalus microplus]|uniref:Uncharacterized protein n=1 Tax=Rhipicephalus microplus TaxID=6941 RepID=A0A9J6EAF8_RHIMP|nr:hypothetical protein HPB51_015466 [Rhipicephalus microplus]